MDEIFCWQDKSNLFEKLIEQSMLGIKPKLGVGTCQKTPVQCPWHQGAPSVDYASPISLDLKKVFVRMNE